jgi:putative transcriptional regulator
VSSGMDYSTEPGTVIAAAPDLRDPNFMHTVVLMCQHTGEGAYGLVINRPAMLTVDVLLPEHPILANEKIRVFTGGPVGLNTLQFLHSVPESIPGGLDLGHGLWLGGELDALASFVSEHAPDADRHVRMILGYSGWGAGQLEAELATGSWIPAPLDRAWVFDTSARSVVAPRVSRICRPTSAGTEFRIWGPK